MRYRDHDITWDFLVEKRFGAGKARWMTGAPLRSARRAATSPTGDWVQAQWSRLGTRAARSYCREPEAFPKTGRVWERAGVLPVPYHFYHPIVHPDDVAQWGIEDPLLGLDLRESEEMTLLDDLAQYRDEILRLPTEPPADGSELYVSTAGGSFLSGDIETLYAMVRHLAPGTILEVGCGSSTRIIELALRENRKEGKDCRHICVEPFGTPWLESLEMVVVRQRIELLEHEIFAGLGEKDILFIDSTHVLRHGGDVKHLYLTVLPTLRPGVHVHVHDIFLPLDYPPEWLRDKKRFWTEQYLLQAFLAFNSEFEVVLGASYLALHHRDEFARACPFFAREDDRAPGSFWMRRNMAPSLSSGSKS